MRQFMALEWINGRHFSAISHQLKSFNPDLKGLKAIETFRWTMMNHPNLAIWWVVFFPVSSTDFTATPELVICPVVLRNQLCHHQPQKLKVRECAGSVSSTPVSRLRSRPLPMPFSTGVRAWNKPCRSCTRIPHRRLWWCRIMQDPSAGANLRYGDLFSVVRGKSEVALEDQSWQKDV